MRTGDLATALTLELEDTGLDPLVRAPDDVPAEAPYGSLPDRASAAEAFQTIAMECLSRFRRNAELLARTGDADALHQARVGLRQLRSAFVIFRPLVADEHFERLRDELRWLAATTTETRDLDTLLARFDKPPLALTAARARACARTVKGLTSARTDRLLRDLLDWITNGVWLEVRDAASLPASEFAATALDRLRRRLVHKGRHLRRLDDEALHEVRIAAKKLRYAAEFFAGLFPADTAQKRAKRLAKAVRALQEHLGELHDIAVAPAILKSAGVPRASWPTLPKRARLVERADASFERLLERKPYWH